jgi:hypothetical protein
VYDLTQTHCRLAGRAAIRTLQPNEPNSQQLALPSYGLTVKVLNPTVAGCDVLSQAHIGDENHAAGGNKYAVDSVWGRRHLVITWVSPRHYLGILPDAYSCVQHHLVF